MFFLLLYISGTLPRVPNFSLWIDLPLSFQVLCLDSASLRLHAAAFKGVLKMLFSTTGRGEIQHLSIPTDRIWYNSNTSQRDTLGTWSIWWRSEMLRICHWQIFGDTLCVCFFFKYIFLYTVYIMYKSHLYVFYVMSSENPWPNEVDSKNPFFQSGWQQPSEISTMHLHAPAKLPVPFDRKGIFFFPGGAARCPKKSSSELLFCDDFWCQWNSGPNMRPSVVFWKSVWSLQIRILNTKRIEPSCHSCLRCWGSSDYTSQVLSSHSSTRFDKLPVLHNEKTHFVRWFPASKAT